MTRQKKVKEAEIVPPMPQPNTPNLISVLVLMIALVEAICPKQGKGQVNADDGRKVMKFIEETINKAYPEVAPMIMGMFGMELLQIMPMMKDPEGIVKNLVNHYTAMATNVNPNPESSSK